MLAHEVSDEWALRHYTKCCGVAYLVECCLYESRAEPVFFTIRADLGVREHDGVPELLVGRKPSDFPVDEYLEPASVLVVPHLNVSHQISLIRRAQVEASAAKRTSSPERAGEMAPQGRRRLKIHELCRTIKLVGSIVTCSTGSRWMSLTSTSAMVAPSSTEGWWTVVRGGVAVSPK